MTKTELVRMAAEKAGLTITQTNECYNAFLEVLTQALKDGEKVQLVGFGTFEVKDVPAKTGINPATGEKIEIAACKKPTLKFGGAFKDTFNA